MNSGMDVEFGSETDSDWLSETDSDWLSETEPITLRNQWRDRLKKTSRRNSFPPDTPRRKRLRKVCKDIKRKSQFSVTCGDKEGILHKVQYKNCKPCILSEGQWFVPTEFEKFGGKAKNKKWKISILYKQIPLQTLIQEGFLFSRSFKKKCTQEPQDQKPLCRKETNNTRTSSTSHDKDSTRTTQWSRTVYSFTSESLDEVWDTETVFRGDAFNVRCDGGEGVLHVPRFATETCGKCIRTQDAWLTPKEFLNRNKANGNWKRDVLCNDIPLEMLIMRRVLKPHVVNCECPICKGETPHLLDQKNDDVCFTCKRDGDLVCCDKCPRAFHHHCHKPALKDDEISDYWTCSFCKILQEIGAQDVS